MLRAPAMALTHKTMAAKPRILIVGAGPTGLTAALALAHQGLVPDIIERRTEPSPLSRAVGILPQTLTQLDALGAGAGIRAEAVQIRHVHVYRNQKPLMRLDFSSNRYDSRIIHGLPQNRTEELLHDALKRLGGHVQYGQVLTGIKTNKETASVEFNTESEQTYDWVIAADGVQSIVRQNLGIGYPGFDLDDEWSVADVDVEGYDGQGFTAWIQKPPGEFVFVIPIEKNRVRIASSTNDALNTIELPFRVVNVRRTGCFRIAVRQADTYQKGRVLLAGDAAHCHSPVGGRGMNLGIADAIEAAAAILNGGTGDYSSTRHRQGHAVMKTSERGRRLVCASGGLAQSMTTLVTKVIHSVPFARDAFFNALTRL